MKQDTIVKTVFKCMSFCDIHKHKKWLPKYLAGGMPGTANSGLTVCPVFVSSRTDGPSGHQERLYRLKYIKSYRIVLRVVDMLTVSNVICEPR